jgi:hypothetical protein
VTQWEYDVLELDTADSYPPAKWTELLNSCGQQGWELVSVQAVDGRLYGFLRKPVP